MTRASLIVGFFVTACGLFWLARGFAAGNVAADPLLVFGGVGNIGIGALVAKLARKRQPKLSVETTHAIS